MPSLDAIRAGFATIDADLALKEKAVENLQTWLSQSGFTIYVPQLEWLIREQKWSILLDSFYQIMPFGTGGRRGAVGIGPNRMNLWTLGASVQGHCEYLRQRFPGDTQLKVVLAYDVRQFADKRGVYNPALANPVMHLSSRNFCEFAAGVYAANGIHSYILPPDAQRYVSTPELSFSIRYLHANGGLNMTASHNPPDDNGSKFYDERGSQPVPPEDQIMSELVDRVQHIKNLPWPDAVKSGKVHFLDAAPHEAYIELCKKQSLIPPPKKGEIRVVYTPLHGVGAGCAGETLLAAGFQYIPVKEQFEPNGQFPNVTKSPNPEVRECMDRAEALARDQHADIILATDPDADRIGGMACTSADGNGDYRFLTGQEIAALLTYFKLARLSAEGDLPASPIVITTEVTTGQITRIAQQFGSQVVNDLLVGFKYHADVVWQLESTGAFGDVRGTPEDVIISTEESHGIMAMTGVRDKDSAAAALLLAELALFLKRQGRTIPDLLDDMNRQYGYYRNELLNLIMTGLEGKQNMAKMLNTLRHNPPKQIGGMPVVSVEDLSDEAGRMGPYKGGTDKASRNFLIFRLSDGTLDGKVCLRPSGTEPKAKAYMEVSSQPRPKTCTEDDWQQTIKNVDAAIQRIATEFLALALGTVGQTPPPGGDKLSR